MTVQGATFNMRGQLYRGHANATALFSSPVVSALDSKLDDLGSSPGRDKALCTWDVQEKKMRALLLGLAIYIIIYSCKINWKRNLSKKILWRKANAQNISFETL